MTGPRCRGPAGLDAGHHVGHYAGVTRYVPSSTLLVSLRMLTGLESSAFSFISKFSALVLLTSTFQVNFPAW